MKVTDGVTLDVEVGERIQGRKAMVMMNNMLWDKVYGMKIWCNNEKYHARFMWAPCSVWAWSLVQFPAEAQCGLHSAS